MEKDDSWRETIEAVVEVAMDGFEEYIKPYLQDILDTQEQEHGREQQKT